MSDSPTERRRRPKPARAAESAPAESPPSSPPPSGPSGPGGLARRLALRANVGWALVTGLAVGFAIGREAYRFGLSDTRATADPNAPSTAFIAAEGAGPTAYAKMADFPA